MLVHFNAMAIKFIFLEFNGLTQCLTLLFCLRARITSCIHVMLDFLVVNAAIHPPGFEDRTEFHDRLVGAGHDLPGDGGTFF